MKDIYCRIKLVGYDLYYSTRKGKFNGTITNLSPTGKFYKYKNVDLALKATRSIYENVYVNTAQINNYGLHDITEADYTGENFILNSNAQLELCTYELVQKTVQPLEHSEWKYT